MTQSDHCWLTLTGRSLNSQKRREKCAFTETYSSLFSSTTPAFFASLASLSASLFSLSFSSFSVTLRFPSSFLLRCSAFFSSTCSLAFRSFSSWNSHALDLTTTAEEAGAEAEEEVARAEEAVRMARQQALQALLEHLAAAELAQGGFEEAVEVEGGADDEEGVREGPEQATAVGTAEAAGAVESMARLPVEWGAGEGGEGLRRFERSASGSARRGEDVEEVSAGKRGKMIGKKRTSDRSLLNFTLPLCLTVDLLQLLLLLSRHRLVRLLDPQVRLAMRVRDDAAVQLDDFRVREEAIRVGGEKASGEVGL